ncbi:MAG: hypothetical protein H7A37_08435 [Chlamydiales bacterium]|nr:hypothetical protein [Chlamydiia bacterium]MCP5508306.1 hypothetical protein [Chlamydiales bacterium]
MYDYPKTIVLRHQKENLKKCSLRGLENREDFLFFKYPRATLPDLTGYILLDLYAPPLSEADSDRGLFVLDGTWRYAERMASSVDTTVMVRRSIPAGIKTAYPRRQEDCSDPERGLASVEAIYMAYLLLGRDASGLMDNYHWRDKFLEINNLM